MLRRNKSICHISWVYKRAHTYYCIPWSLALNPDCNFPSLLRKRVWRHRNNSFNRKDGQWLAPSKFSFTSTKCTDWFTSWSFSYKHIVEWDWWPLILWSILIRSNQHDMCISLWWWTSWSECGECTWTSPSWVKYYELHFSTGRWTLCIPRWNKVLASELSRHSQRCHCTNLSVWVWILRKSVDYHYKWIRTAPWTQPNDCPG